MAVRYHALSWNLDETPKESLNTLKYGQTHNA